MMQIKNKFTGHVYAGKRVRVGRGAESKVQLMNEIHVMIDMDHPNIVRLHEVFESKTSLYVVRRLKWRAARTHATLLRKLFVCSCVVVVGSRVCAAVPCACAD